MYHVQQLRNALDLVDHYVVASRITQDQLRQTFWTSSHLPVHGRAQQIYPEGIGEPVLEERRLARPAWPQQEEASAGDSINRGARSILRLKMDLVTPE